MIFEAEEAEFKGGLGSKTWRAKMKITEEESQLGVEYWVSTSC